jgi:hypothetical protein
MRYLMNKCRRDREVGRMHRLVARRAGGEYIHEENDRPLKLSWLTGVY